MATVSELEKQNAEATLLAFISENFPDIDTRQGSVFRRLVVAPAAAMFAEIQKEAVVAQNSQSLLTATQESADGTIDDTVTEQIIANYFITRKAGSAARGTIKVLVAQDKAYAVSTTTQFQSQDGLTYTSEVDATYVSNPGETEEKLFVDTATDQFFFLVPVVADVVGTAGNVEQGTGFVVGALSFIDRSVISLEAFTPFSGGTDQESINDLIVRAQTAITVRDLVTTKSINAVILEEFQNLVNLQPIGFGDIEMLRDIVYPTQIHTGGAVDIWLRGSRLPQRVVYTKQVIGSPVAVTLIEPEAPVYEIEKIEAEIEGVLQVLDPDTYTITFDSNNWFFQNTLALAEAPKAARFSDREKVIITFDDQSLFEKEVLITATVPTSVNEVQTFVETEENRVLAAKMLARGFCPIFVSFELNYVRNANEEAVDEEALAQALLDHINTIAPDEPLKVSKLIDIAHNFGVDRIDLPLTVTGNVFKNDGTSETISSSNKLEVETEFDIGFSQKICQFYVERDDITINATVE